MCQQSGNSLFQPHHYTNSKLQGLWALQRCPRLLRRLNHIYLQTHRLGPSAPGLRLGLCRIGLLCVFHRLAKIGLHRDKWAHLQTLALWRHWPGGHKRYSYARSPSPHPPYTRKYHPDDNQTHIHGSWMPKQDSRPSCVKRLWACRSSPKYTARIRDLRRSFLLAGNAGPLCPSSPRMQNLAPLSGQHHPRCVQPQAF